MDRLKASLVCVVLCFALNGHAENKDDQDLNDFSYCEVSKVEMNDYEPEIFEKNNNLLRKSGQDPLFCGESIVVYGRVLDQNCVPVTDAKIYAWQTDCEGKYPYKPLRKKVVDKELINEDSNLTFTGNGIATTNNNGEFHFVTVYPPHMHGYAPHLNIRVEHFSMGNLQTRLVLQGNKVRNAKKDPDLSTISSEASRRGMSIYKFEVVIPGVNNKDYD